MHKVKKLNPNSTDIFNISEKEKQIKQNICEFITVQHSPGEMLSVILELIQSWIMERFTPEERNAPESLLILAGYISQLEETKELAKSAAPKFSNQDHQYILTILKIVVSNWNIFEPLIANQKTTMDELKVKYLLECYQKKDLSGIGAA